jgi:hypothetical protein
MEEFKFTCSLCNQVHSAPFSIEFQKPDVENVSEILHKTSEVWVLGMDGDPEPQFFLRVILKMNVIGLTEPFLWGVWVNVSEDELERYERDGNVDDVCGMISNTLPYYEDEAFGVPAMLKPGSEDGQRPLLELTEARSGQSEMVMDFINGIPANKAQRIAELCQHRMDGASKSPKSSRK